MPSLSTLREHRARYVEFLTEADEDPIERTQPLLRLAWVADDPDAAAKRLESIVEGIVAAYEAVGYTPLSEDALAALRGSFREFAADWFIVGTPEMCAREIERYRDELSGDHLVLKIANPGMDPETVTEGIQRFGSDVLPLVD
jgi:alkanesulfonate monooxygenase SsuD/methylene tetrahydromethanopterin reductase-like flavin-dependent oxidoreductase (luciferase family)